MFSFKLRGAFNKMAKMPKEALQRGVITSSAGNHAQGVALAASKLVSQACDMGAAAYGSHGVSVLHGRVMPLCAAVQHSDGVDWRCAGSKPGLVQPAVVGVK